MAAFDDDVAPQASRGLSFLPQRDAAPSPTIVRQSAGSGDSDGAALATLVAEAQRRADRDARDLRRAYDNLADIVRNLKTEFARDRDAAITRGVETETRLARVEAALSALTAAAEAAGGSKSNPGAKAAAGAKDAGGRAPPAQRKWI